MAQPVTVELDVLNTLFICLLDDRELAEVSILFYLKQLESRPSTAKRRNIGAIPLKELRTASEPLSGCLE